MTCANCVATVERQLRSVPGVMDVSVVLETERATVKMIPNQVSMADLKRAVEKAGYEISPEGSASKLDCPIQKNMGVDGKLPSTP